jgi:predicted dinucleotide-binding enzyme
MTNCPETELLLTSSDTKFNMAVSRKCVGILGTGDYARAISKRLIFSGYDVIMGSRSPAARQLSAFDECLCGVTLTSIDACVQRCDVIVVAIHVENFQVTLTPRAGLFAGKVVVDVSNRTNRYAAQSNAEFLQSLLPEARVVKAFNTVSAYAMEDQTVAGSLRVFVGCDDSGARERVLTIARDLGFSPCDMGSLKSARSMEAFVLKVFPGWKVPLFFTFGIFNLWTLYCVYIYFIEKTEYRWDQV